MSNNSKKTEPAVENITSLPEPETKVEETVEKRPNVFVRGFRAVKQNPKTTIAVVAGAALVGVGAALGRASAPTAVSFTEDSDSDVEEYTFDPDPSLERIDDTTVA